MLSRSSLATRSLYAESVNPQWVRLLDLLGMNVRYQRCEGCELYAEDGTRYLDFLSGYCVHNTGHNHPYIIEALKQELDRSGPAMLQSHVPELAGELSQRLYALAGGGLTKTFFCSSGSEGVEAAIKFARASTKRNGLLFCEGAFHGLTCGALSMMDNSFWTEGFGPLLAGTTAIPFDNLTVLEEQLKTRKYAAFFVEPVQSEGGIRVPARGYLRAAQQLCQRYETLLVLDEVQTGMFRTGRFLAGHHFDVQPDMVVLAKALSGGLIPVGAVIPAAPATHASPKIGIRLMLGRKFMRLIRRASIDGLATPVTETKKMASRSCSQSPARVSARQMDCSAKSSATLIQ